MQTSLPMQRIVYHGVEIVIVPAQCAVLLEKPYLLVSPYIVSNCNQRRKDIKTELPLPI